MSRRTPPGTESADAGPQVVGVAVDQRRRQQSLAQHLLRAVGIVQDPIEQLRALRHRGLDLDPFLRRQDERNGVDVPGPVDAARVGVHVEGHPGLADLAGDGFDALAHQSGSMRAADRRRSATSAGAARRGR